MTAFALSAENKASLVRALAARHGKPSQGATFSPTNRATVWIVTDVATGAWLKGCFDKPRLDVWGHGPSSDTTAPSKASAMLPLEHQQEASADGEPIPAERAYPIREAIFSAMYAEPSVAPSAETLRAAIIERAAHLPQADTVWAVWYVAPTGELQLCEFDGCVCYEAHATREAAEADAAHCNATIPGSEYVARIVPAGVACCLDGTDVRSGGAEAEWYGQLEGGFIGLCMPPGILPDGTTDAPSVVQDGGGELPATDAAAEASEAPTGFLDGFGDYAGAGDRITCEVDGFLVVATLHRDDDGDAPWDRSCGHGEVSGWRSRDRWSGARGKRPGEVVLCEDGSSARFYDFAGACRAARKDGWLAPDDAERSRAGLPPIGTARQRAARAAEADFAFLKAWCEDEWCYVGVSVTVERDGFELVGDFERALWGIESNAGDYLREVANDLLPEALEAARVKLAELAPACDSVEALTDMLGEAVDYLERFADDSEQPEDGACRTLIARIKLALAV